MLGAGPRHHEMELPLWTDALARPLAGRQRVASYCVCSRLSSRIHPGLIICPASKQQFEIRTHGHRVSGRPFGADSISGRFWLLSKALILYMNHTISDRVIPYGTYNTILLDFIHFLNHKCVFISFSKKVVWEEINFKYYYRKKSPALSSVWFPYNLNAICVSIKNKKKIIQQMKVYDWCFLDNLIIYCWMIFTPI